MLAPLTKMSIKSFADYFCDIEKLNKKFFRVQRMHVKAAKIVVCNAPNLQPQFQMHPLDRDQPAKLYFYVTKVNRHNASYQSVNFEVFISHAWNAFWGLRRSKSDQYQHYYMISRKNIIFERSVRFHTLFWMENVPTELFSQNHATSTKSSWFHRGALLVHFWLLLGLKLIPDVEKHFPRHFSEWKMSA